MRNYLKNCVMKCLIGVNNMETYREEYNTLLARYYKGCNYIKNHPEESEKLIPELLKILKKMNIILAEHPADNDEEVLNGFKR